MELQLNYEIISIGLTSSSNNKKDTVKKFIILCAKYFIFINKCQSKIPIANHFKNFLGKEIELEKCIAMKHDKLETHETKWNSFIN